MAGQPPPPPPLQPPPLARRGRSRNGWIQRPRPSMGFVPVGGYRPYSYGYAYTRGYTGVRPWTPQPQSQMGGNRFMENTSEVDVVQGGLVNHGTGVFHLRLPIFYNYRASYTIFHPRVPSAHNNGANCNKDNKGKKKKVGGAEAANQISTSSNATNWNNAAGGSVESHEHEPSSEINLPEEWTY